MMKGLWRKLLGWLRGKTVEDLVEIGKDVKSTVNDIREA